ncbi:MAG TPA: hypothetical protein VFB20_08265 [Burkholderiales bacterium]|nr:hypothetical protein [Burkholderiales bacterium]
MEERKARPLRVLSGAALAVAAAQLFLTVASEAPAAEKSEAKVQCAGVNACKGKSECATASNSCHGQNACKGQGWVSLSEEQCIDKGGTAAKG